MKIFMKIAAAAAFALAFSASSFAQVATEQENLPEENYSKRVLLNKWYQNWELGARVGTQAYLGEYCLTDFALKDWWTLPAIDLSISKWGTQSLGMTIGYNIGKFKSLYQSNPAGTEYKSAAFADPANDAAYNGSFNVASGWMSNLYIDVFFDVTNLLGEYRKDRIYSLIGYMGGGIITPLTSTAYKTVNASFNAGLINRFRLTDHLSLDLAIRGTLHDDSFNGISYYTSGDITNISVDATFGATAGLSYRFDLPTKKTKPANGAKRENNEGWTEVKDIVRHTEEYKEVAHEVEVKAAEVDSVKAVVVEKEQVIEQKNEQIVVLVKEAASFQYTQFVNFVIDEWKISNREKVAVMLAAEAIKAHPEVKFQVIGYADKQTADPEYNQILSDNRAMAVYHMLIDEFGVDKDQLVKSAEGGVDLMYFSDPQCSRAVVIKAAEN